MSAAGQFLRRTLRTAFLAAALLGSAAPAQEAGRAQAPPATAPTNPTGARTTDDRTLSFRVAKDARADGGIDYYDEAVHSITYYHDGAYDPKALGDINLLLRDRDKDAVPANGMDRGLLDLLFSLKTTLQAAHPGQEIVFHVISGYRSPETNAALRADKDNPYRAWVSKTSEHIRARAIDIFVPGIGGEELRNAAWCQQKGGVGWYPQFREIFPYEYIHADSGPVRHWGFDPKKVTCGK